MANLGPLSELEKGEFPKKVQEMLTSKLKSLRDKLDLILIKPEILNGYAGYGFCAN